MSNYLRTIKQIMWIPPCIFSPVFGIASFSSWDSTIRVSPPVEWSDTLGEEIEKARAAGDPADGTTYYKHVIAALERLVHHGDRPAAP